MPKLLPRSGVLKVSVDKLEELQELLWDFLDRNRTEDASFDGELQVRWKSPETREETLLRKQQEADILAKALENQDAYIEREAQRLQTLRKEIDEENKAYALRNQRNNRGR